MGKTAYCFDENGIYTGIAKCFLDPLESELQNEEVYLLPAHATYDPVPQFNSETHFAKWNGIGWEIIEKPPTPIPPTPSPSIEERFTELENENKALKIRLAQAEQTNADISLVQQELLEVLVEMEVI